VANAIDLPNIPQNVDYVVRFSLIACEKVSSDTMMIEKLSGAKGWKTAIVHNGEDALRLLKLRTWDLVIFDEELPILPPLKCVTSFREWEEKNRVTRQKNICLLSDACWMASGSQGLIQLPQGFDHSLGKPLRNSEFKSVLAKAEQCAQDFGSQNIVTR